MPSEKNDDKTMHRVLVNQEELYSLDVGRGQKSQLHRFIFRRESQPPPLPPNRMRGPRSFRDRSWSAHTGSPTHEQVTRHLP